MNHLKIKLYIPFEEIDAFGKFVEKRCLGEDISIDISTPKVRPVSVNEFIPIIQSIAVKVSGGIGVIKLIQVFSKELREWVKLSKKDIVIKKDGKEISVTNISSDELETILHESINL